MAFCFNFPAPESFAGEDISVKLDKESKSYLDGAGCSSDKKKSCQETEFADIHSIAAFREYIFSPVTDGIGLDFTTPRSETAVEPEAAVGQPFPETVWYAVTVGDSTLEFVCPQWLESVIEGRKDPSSVLSAAFGNSTHLDIVPQVYEGGFRVWDGACDMLSFLSTERTPADFKGKKVLELGCGAGLPALFALLNGATAHFHDYNAEVIELATIPNIQKNLAVSKVTIPLPQDRVRLFSGDWREFCRHLTSNNSSNPEDARYDIILTSDTVYRKDVLKKLCSALPSLLRQDGCILVAGKSYYFGLDGGTDAFRDELERASLMEVTATKEYPDSVRREVLTVKWKR